MLTLTTLASGSSGNCTLISAGTTHVLVDAGISCRRISVALGQLGLSLEHLTAILVTHEHSDHVSGLATLHKRRPNLPIYTSGGTAGALMERNSNLCTVLDVQQPGTTFFVGELDVTCFATLHDSAQSMGFTLSCGEEKVAVVTDLGMVTDPIVEAISGAKVVLVEANHDPDWLRQGDYPYYLKERVLGRYGHLSNEAGGELARHCVETGAHTVILGHLSLENNSPDQAYQTVRALLPESCTATLAVAPRSEMGITYRA